MRLRFADLVLDASARTLSRDGAPLSLTPKAFHLLELLAYANPSAVARDALVQQLWPQTFVEPGNLHNLISEIRRVAGADVIRTVHRFGYAVEGEVVRERDAPFRLVVGADAIPLPTGETIVGRENIDAPDVSRRHARIVVDGANVTVEDLGSKNGTWIGATRVERSPLRDGDEITFGRTRARIVASCDESTLTISPP